MKIAVRFFALIMVINILLTGCQKKPADASAVKVRSLTMGVGAALPDAEDFVSQIPEGWTVRFAKDYYRSIYSMGEHSLTLIATDTKGRECEFSVKLKLIKDNESPVILGVGDLSACLGDGIAYRAGITVSDNCDGKVTLTVDSSAVKTTVEGSYPVTYTATDAVGNTSTVTVILYLYKERVTEEMLFAKVDEIIQLRQIPTTGSLEMQVREVYDYVYYNIDYVAHSNKTDWVRAAYEGLRTGQGDCYTYFAVSKAFFERLQIENMDIQRTPGIVDERHYWNFVNIGNAASPRWYHFDACQLRGATHSGCLLTDAQVKEYTAYRVYENGVSGYFYAYDATRYPASHTTVITETPAWGS